MGEPSEVEAFADLYNRTFHPLVAYCRRYCPPGYDPEDIAQEALAKAWSSWDRYSPSRPFWPWVATIARRLCVDYWRRDERAGARVGSATALETCPQPRPDELSEAADECRMAVTAFRRLRPDHQRIVGLRDIEGWSYEDIARFEGVTVESIRGSLRRARMSLRKSYDSLAKGGVAALVPGLGLGLDANGRLVGDGRLGAFVRMFQAARARLAARMASWQATMQDAGVASSRLGEALIGLVALSVAAVGLGSPAPVAVRAGDDGAGASASAEVADSGAGAAADAGADGAAGGAVTAPAAAGPSDGLANVAPEWKQRFEGVDDVLPIDGAQPNNVTIMDIEPSPNYSNDGTIFATGEAAACVESCKTLLVSRDRGATWADLQSVGLVGSTLLLPPNFPDDKRIFATGGIGLQVSDDDGKTFVTIAPALGTAAMSPAFAAGDPRILLPERTGLQYNDRTRLPEPMGLKPGPVTSTNDFTFAFPTEYQPDRPVVFIGGRVDKGLGSVGVVYRCEGDACGAPVELPGSYDGLPRLTVSRGPQGDVLWAMTGSVNYRSVDGGRSFEAVARPTPTSILVHEAASPDGRLYASAMNPDSDLNDPAELWYTADAGSTWVRVPTASAPSFVFPVVSRLSDGTLLAALASSGLACSRDEGKTWTPTCR